MRIPTLILIVMVATLPMAPASPQDKVNPSRKDQAQELAKKVKELQKERLVTLIQMADATAREYQAGAKVSFEEVVEARLLVHKAGLDGAEKESDRITLYKIIVDELKKFEKSADERVKGARMSRRTFLKVKARRLEAEINLERAIAKEAKESR